MLIGPEPSSIRPDTAPNLRRLHGTVVRPMRSPPPLVLLLIAASACAYEPFGPAGERIEGDPPTTDAGADAGGIADPPDAATDAGEVEDPPDAASDGGGVDTDGGPDGGPDAGEDAGAPLDPCANHLLDADESDEDCGGPRCEKCGNGSRCGAARDCASARCEAGRCAAPPACTPAGTTCDGRCGTVPDNCGTPVACAGCTAPEICGSDQRCACVGETDAVLCAANRVECGTKSVTDRCRRTRTVTCAGCDTASGLVCASNVCTCPAGDTDAELCDAAGYECGPAALADSCGSVKTRPCGSCAFGDACVGRKCRCDADTWVVMTLDTGNLRPLALTHDPRSTHALYWDEANARLKVARLEADRVELDTVPLLNVSAQTDRAAIATDGLRSLRVLMGVGSELVEFRRAPGTSGVAAWTQRVVDTGRVFTPLAMRHPGPDPHPTQALVADVKSGVKHLRWGVTNAQNAWTWSVEVTRDASAALVTNEATSDFAPHLALVSGTSIVASALSAGTLSWTVLGSGNAVATGLAGSNVEVLFADTNASSSTLSFTRRGFGWSTPVSVTLPGKLGGHGFAAAWHGAAVDVAVYDADHRAVSVVRRDGTYWQPRTRLIEETAIEGAVLASTNEDGSLHVLYRVPGGAIRYAYRCADY